MASAENKLLIHIHRVFDTALTAAAFSLAYSIKKYFLPYPIGGLEDMPIYHAVLFLSIIISYSGFASSRYHLNYRMTITWRFFWKITKLVTLNTAVLILCLYALKITDISRLLIGIFYSLNILLLMFSWWVMSLVRGKTGAEHALLIIIGSEGEAREFVKFISDNPDLKYKVLGCLDIDVDSVGKAVYQDVCVIGTVEQLVHYLDSEVVDEIVLATPIDKLDKAGEYLAVAELVGVPIRILPHWHLQKLLADIPKFYNLQFEEFNGVATLLLTATPFKRGWLLVKAAMDYVLAGIGIVLLCPLLAAIACTIKIVSPGPVFFKQERVGLFGRKFTLFKFRTMVVGAEKMQEEMTRYNEADGPVFKIKHDPRIIPRVGTVLRKTSLDELPNLINVLRGEMSLVGPRPPVPSEVRSYDLSERRRFYMKPGLTCIWQISKDRNQTEFEEWMKMDLEYIDNWSLWLDLKITLKTLKVVLFGYGM
ncbi:MAG: sugar transferase [Deltaproteobacteria bacterium]|nr:sugar transferase [Deltaproteobacteria bacterium]